MLTFSYNTTYFYAMTKQTLISLFYGCCTIKELGSKWGVSKQCAHQAINRFGVQREWESHLDSMMQWRLVPSAPGVYCVWLSSQPQIIYYGSSSNARTRCQEHWNVLRARSHENDNLQDAFNQNPATKICFSFLLEEPDRTVRLLEESRFIKSDQSCYNYQFKGSKDSDKRRKNAARAKKYYHKTRPRRIALAKIWRDSHPGYYDKYNKKPAAFIRQ